MRQQNTYNRDLTLSRLEKAFTLKKGIESKALVNLKKTDSSYSLIIYIINDKSKKVALYPSLSRKQFT